jgi:hypothetical protein
MELIKSQPLNAPKDLIESKRLNLMLNSIFVKLKRLVQMDNTLLVKKNADFAQQDGLSVN